MRLFWFFCMRPWTVLWIFFLQIQVVEPQEWSKLTGNDCWSFPLILMGCSLGPMWSQVGSIPNNNQREQKIDPSCSFFLHYFVRSCCVGTLISLLKIFDCRTNVGEDYNLNNVMTSARSKMWQANTEKLGKFLLHWGFCERVFQISKAL